MSKVKDAICSICVLKGNYCQQKDCKNNKKVRKEFVKLIMKDDLLTFIVDKLVEFRHNKRFKFNAKMSGKDWTLANWLVKDIKQHYKEKLK